MAKEKYVEPKDFMPKDIRKKYGLGEFAEEEKKKGNRTLDDAFKAEPAWPQGRCVQVPVGHGSQRCVRCFTECVTNHSKQKDGSDRRDARGAAVAAWPSRRHSKTQGITGLPHFLEKPIT